MNETSGRGTPARREQGKTVPGSGSAGQGPDIIGFDKRGKPVSNRLSEGKSPPPRQGRQERQEGRPESSPRRSQPERQESRPEPFPPRRSQPERQEKPPEPFPPRRSQPERQESRPESFPPRRSQPERQESRPEPFPPRRSQPERLTEEEPPRVPKKEFHLRAEGELRQIPDYTRSHSDRGGQGATIFVKIMLALIIVGISVFLAILIIFAAQEVFGVSKPDREIVVDIPQNAGVVQISEILEDTGVIQSALIFKAYFKTFNPDSNFQYGTYSLNSNMSYGMIINELSKYSSSRDEVKVSFPEGFTLYQIAQRLEENGVCNGREFIQAVNSTDFGLDFEKQIGNSSLKYHKLEGYVFPDTYFFFENDNPVNVAKKFLSNFDTRVDSTLRARMTELGYTLEETIIIASIVQQEAGRPEEMARVASVYQNRLKNKGAYPNLQADPTRGYADELRLQMNVVDQRILDAYNTYEGTGLPPGPICNPGLEAIKATLYPEETPYFYFCTNLDSPLESREFYYAETLEEHEQNLRKAGLV